ncbi:MAG TPA: response regulator [Rhizomicrobium sp.]|nr:response regulator [Rhizomicrobium sp.]
MYAPQNRRAPLRILCIEEDPIQRKLLQACLEVMGADALIFPRPLDAVWTFRKQPVDLVFMDIDQHIANGLTAFEAIRATPVRGKTVPIMAVTENECRWSEQDYRDAGFAGLFLKPVEPTRLFRAIDDVLARWNPPELNVVRRNVKEKSRTFGHANQAR